MLGWCSGVGLVIVIGLYGFIVIFVFFGFGLDCELFFNVVFGILWIVFSLVLFFMFDCFF